MRLEHTVKLKGPKGSGGYNQYFVGERNPAISDRLYVKIFIWDDVPEDIGKEMIAKGAEEVEPIGAAACSPPSRSGDDVMGSVRP